MRVLEAGEGAGNHLENFPALFGIFHFVEFIDGLGEFYDQVGAEIIGDVGAVAGGSLLIERATLFEEFVPLGAAFASVGPIGVAAETPIGEVVFGEGASAEFFGEDALDFGQGVEPGEEFGAVGAVFEAMVEFIADGFGEAGDFSGAGFHGGEFLTADYADERGLEAGRAGRPTSPRLRRAGRRSQAVAANVAVHPDVLTRRRIAEKLTVMFSVKKRVKYFYA